jgi:thiamine pyrophosphate-dependent acetolactate synthase large subunit-like protein
VRAAAGDAKPRAELTARRPPPAPSIAPDEITVAADLLEESWAASRPVILAGRGAVASGARADLMRIGDAVGALYATSLGAKGLFAGDPWDLGVAGTMSDPGASELLSRSDMVLVFGASLGPFTTMAGDLFRDTRMVRVDTDSAVVNGAPEHVIPVLGDAGLVAARLAAELERRAIRRAGYRTEYAADRLAEDRAAPSAPGQSDPRALISELDRLLPSPRTMILDAGAHLALSGRCLSPSDPAHVVLPSEYSSLGAGQPVALGAAVAQPDRCTVLALGDGGFMMTLADLDTAVRYKLPVIVLVMNNGGFAAEYMNLELDGDPTSMSLYTNPDFAAVARSLGADGITIARREDLAGLGERLARRSGPVVVDVKLPIDAENSWVGVSHRVHAGVASELGNRGYHGAAHDLDGRDVLLTNNPPEHGLGALVR